MPNTKAYIMLVCATLFWAGNFMIGKFAFFSNIPPMTLVFFRWLIVWFILIPFTYKIKLLLFLTITKLYMVSTTKLNSSPLPSLTPLELFLYII